MDQPNGPPDDLAHAELRRLALDASREANWKRWGPYLSERQWGTVREDYSADGNCWDYFPHDHARSRAYRWGEDGLLGICDRECRLCFALALWNGKDPILKERLFGLVPGQANHGEDVKELYFYLDSTPTHSYMKGLYKYPQAEFPYSKLEDENRRRSRLEPEYELSDTGVFNEDRYFDVFAEYAKAAPDDIMIRLTVANRGPEAASLHLLPTLWFKNSWSWGCDEDGCERKPWLSTEGDDAFVCEQASLGVMRLIAEPAGNGVPARERLVTENETNYQRIYHGPSPSPFVKDSFHERVVHGEQGAVNPKGEGTKAAFWYPLSIPAGGEAVVRLRLVQCEGAGGQQPAPILDRDEFERVFAARIAEADAFYGARIPEDVSAAQRSIIRQAYAGLLWTKQFYYYVVERWLKGDPAQPPPPPERLRGRNSDWTYLFARDVISMPDKWEYPWFAAWDLAFHTIPLAKIDPDFAKAQLLLLLREWYAHPNGQIPAYEFSFGDVNPPVHAWACWRVYKISGPRGKRDRLFLERAFQKLIINFTWWVNRKDIDGKHVFAGGFLGLDNIGLFDRNRTLPGGHRLEEADGTAWMAFYCGTMLSIALELASEDPAYEDVASKFFEHFIAITDAMNSLGGTGLWDETDGFYYDHLTGDGQNIPMRVRSVVGVIPLFACEILESDVLDRLPGFARRMRWFLDHRRDLARHISYMVKDRALGHVHYLLAVPSRERLERTLRYVLDETEFLSPYGVRSLSRCYKAKPYAFEAAGEVFSIRYSSAESTTAMFGGNSNWRGPIWFPINFLLIEVLERYEHFYHGSFQVECPTGSGRMMNLGEVARELTRRLGALFLPDASSGRRPCNGVDALFDRPHFRDLVLFHEYFDGDVGRGLGASHQTGWTGLIAHLMEDVAWQESHAAEAAAAPAGEKKE